MSITPSKLCTFFSSTTYAAKNIAVLVTNRVHYTVVPQRQANRFPRIYLERQGKNSLVDLDGSKGKLITDQYALEVISDKLSDVITISDLLWSDVHGHYGLINSSDNAKGILIDNQSDDYEPKGVGGDLGLDVASFVFQIMYATS